MSASLYDLSVPTFLQTLRAISGCLQRAADYCVKTGLNPDNLVVARLYSDMAPLHFHIEAMTHHAVWGVEAIRTGAFTPPALVGKVSLRELKTAVDTAVDALERLSLDDINIASGKDLNITLYRPPNDEEAPQTEWAPRDMALTSETYILSFALPNFHFHAVTAYAILRANGVPIGKRNYEGQLRARPLPLDHPSV